MKNKNMILMAVAIGCGLVAAFLTTKLTGSAPTIDTVDVIVAKKDIPIGTIIEEKDFNNLLNKVPMPRASLPPDIVMDPEQLKGKRLARTIRTGNYFAPADVSNNAGVPVPEGMLMYSIKLDAVRAVTGFVLPGDKVDILSMVKVKKESNLKTSARILTNMLVLAVDINDRRPEGGGPAIPTLQSVTLAVKPDQAKLLHTAEQGGGDIRLIRRPEGYKPTEAEDKPDELVFGDENKQAPAPPPLPTGPETVEVVFLKKEIPLNTKITTENITEFFELRPFVAPAPEKALRSLDDLKNKFVIKQGLQEELPVLSSAFGDEAVVIAKPKEEPKEEPKEIKPVAPVVTEKKPEPFRHTLTIQGPQSTQQFHWEGESRDKLKKVEKLTDESSSTPSKPESTLSTPTPETKPETKPTPSESTPTPAQNPRERVTLAR